MTQNGQTSNGGKQEIFTHRDISWLAFARRVMHQVTRPDLPLLERVKFVGIIGMIHDEFFMKRAGGLKREISRAPANLDIDEPTPLETFMECRAELLDQISILETALVEEILPALATEGVPLLSIDQVTDEQDQYLKDYFKDSVLPILTPLAVDDEHPFPFISNQGLNLAIQVKDKKKSKRFVRLKVPGNRPRWIELPGAGYIPLEQVIARNLELVFPGAKSVVAYQFRVTRGMDVEQYDQRELDDQEIPENPGRLLRQVTDTLKARRFAGAVRLQVSAEMPQQIEEWLALQLNLGPEDVYTSKVMMGLNDFLQFRPPGREDLCDRPHVPVPHQRLVQLDPEDPGAIFAEIRRGDLLVHHPYHDFNATVLRFIESAALDPQVLGIKLTIYRTSSDSPIIRALVEAARRGKQVSVLVEITARFDEAPNIEWCRLLEREGVHVAYGVEKLKTHVKLALVIREEDGRVRRYAHVGTGNYHTGTARLYEDLGLLTADPAISDDATAVFNELTGAIPHAEYRKLLVAPHTMFDRFLELINNEAENARAGKPAGIYAKLNQLQESEIIQSLYHAGQAGVPVTLNVRGLCCLRAGVPGLSDNIRVYSVIGRFLEHSRLYRFVNGGDPLYFIGSADWMTRNLRRRVETVTPLEDATLKDELEAIISVYESDNSSAWDMQADGSYVLRQPGEGEQPLAAQEHFIASQSIPVFQP
jgi:polyphosphate kinase